MSSSRFSLFLRAIGIKPGFRRARTGPGSLLHLAVAAGVGVVSGQYIFKQPLEEYFAELEANNMAQRNAEGKYVKKEVVVSETRE